MFVSLQVGPSNSVHWTQSVRIGVGITEKEWISSETERYLWRYYFVASLIFDIKAIIRLFARIDRKYRPF